jgi:hypothetical protein
MHGRMDEIDPNELMHVTGGMRWEQFRRSTNVEDRRSPKAIRRDQEWWYRNVDATPMPPRRPRGL